MATLADSFLDDLDELGESSDEEEQQQQQEEGGGANGAAGAGGGEDGDDNMEVRKMGRLVGQDLSFTLLANYVLGPKKVGKKNTRKKIHVQVLIQIPTLLISIDYPTRINLD